MPSEQPNVLSADYYNHDVRQMGGKTDLAKQEKTSELAVAPNAMAFEEFLANIRHGLESEYEKLRTDLRPDFFAAGMAIKRLEGIVSASDRKANLDLMDLIKQHREAGEAVDRR